MRDPGFEEFVGASLPTLSRYAYALTGGRHASEDLVQDTLVKLGRAWRRIERDGNPLGYARTIMFRTYVSRWRVLRRRPIEEPYQETSSAERGFAAVEARDELRRALRGLPRLQRAVLVLTYLDDLPDDSIAELLGRETSTVRSLRRRGLIALRAMVPAPGVTEVSHGNS
ncbi:MAG TPA: SigE family RNA polymerase sigma factor [Micromonosporaceae bacterium]|nr:SigE family RNA polymerase sigma factor [Micromonosporaceae bacterium]